MRGALRHSPTRLEVVLLECKENFKTMIKPVDKYGSVTWSNKDKGDTVTLY